MRFKLVRV